MQLNICTLTAQKSSTKVCTELSSFFHYQIPFLKKSDNLSLLHGRRTTGQNMIIQLNLITNSVGLYHVPVVHHFTKLRMPDAQL